MANPSNLASLSHLNAGLNLMAPRRVADSNTGGVIQFNIPLSTPGPLFQSQG